MALERVREGEKPSALIAAANYGFHRTVIYRCMNAATVHSKGVRRLAACKASGRQKKLTATRERQVCRWVNGRNPMQHDFDFGLWTRQIVRQLARREFGVTLTLASIGAMLARLGLTPQKPLQPAYQRDPDAIEHWQRATYPAIVRRAQREQADIYFWDESGFRADAIQGTTWGVNGQTPVAHVPGQRQSIGAASAVSAKGVFWFARYQPTWTGELFVELSKKLMYHREKPLHLVIDGLRAHKKAAIKEYVARTQGKFTLHLLPGYAPDLNPDELVWSHAKRTARCRRAKSWRSTCAHSLSISAKIRAWCARSSSIHVSYISDS
jgi:transposase